MITRLLRILVLTGLCGAGMVAADAAIPGELDKLKLGMSVEEFQRAYPDLPVRQAKKDPNPAVPTLPYGEAQLSPVAFAEFKACDATIRFFEGQLFQYSLDCHDKDAVTAWVRKNFGEPKLAGKGASEWRDSERSLALAGLTGKVTISDLKLLSGFQSQLMRLVMSRRAAAGKPAAVPGAASPAPPK